MKDLEKASLCVTIDFVLFYVQAYFKTDPLAFILFFPFLFFLSQNILPFLKEEKVVSTFDIL